MSLGVLNNLSAIYAENNLNNTSSSLNTVLQQLSSGSKINSGADDAAGLSLVDGLRANSMALAQSQTNASEGVGLLTVADGALSQVTNLLNRAVTLSTEASNGTLSSSQDTAANQEYQSILSEINNIGTTTTYNGSAVFNTNTNIYTGDSSTAGASVDSLNIRSLSSSNVGDTDGAMSYSNGATNVFVDLSKAGHNAAITDSLGASTATTTINVGYMTTGANGAAVSSTAAISVGAGTNFANTAQGLISAINSAGLGLNATFATAAQAGSAAVATATASAAGGGGAADTGIEISGAGIGASGTNFNGVGVVGSLSLGANQTLGGTLSIVGSDGASHNITLGTANSTDTLANLESTVNAAGYGVTASINGSTGALEFTSASSNVSVSAANLSESTTATTNPAIQVAGSTIGTITVANAGDALSAGVLTFTEGLDTTGTTSTLAVGTGGAVGTSTDTISHLMSTINASSTTTGVSATLNASAIGTLGQAGYHAANTVMTLTKAGGDLGTPNVAVTTAITDTPAANSTVSLGASTGTLGTLTVAASGDTLGGSAGNKIILTDGSGTTHNVDLSGNGGVSLSSIVSSVNGDAAGIFAQLSSDGKTVSFYETGTNTAAPIVALSGALADTSPAGTASYTASTATGTLGSLTTASSTDTLTGTLSIKDYNSATVATLSLANQTLQQVEATINGTAAYGITASLDSTGKVLSFAATNTDTGSNPTIANTGNITDTTPAVVTNLKIGNVPTVGAANSTTLGTLSLSGTLTGSITLGSNTIDIGANNNTGSTLATAINAGNYGVTAAFSNGSMTFTSANSAMTVTTTSLLAGGVAVGNMTASGATTSSYYTRGISGTVSDTSTSGGTSNVGITRDANGSGGIATISYTDGAGQSLSATDLSSQSDAEAALTALNASITDVAAQDGYIGAQINTLNSVSQVLSTQAENVTSAQNAVQATDYASATSNMSKYEILSQTGISALAQANSMQQEVTKLLQ
jgi:flagellin